jgi:DNA modification methylase/DNA-binding XRE family transcriptional regulator
MGLDISTTLVEIRSRAKLSQERLAQILGVSFVSVNRWERGASVPSPAQMQRILRIYQASYDLWTTTPLMESETKVFSSRGIRHNSASLPLFEESLPSINLANEPFEPIIKRLTHGRYYSSNECSIQETLKNHLIPASTVNQPPFNGMSAGKNTYTYDAHTYHTKVPPQGIAELLKHYLPAGGILLDPFAGSGMTGVASRVLGYDCILNELSPAACFIANRFISYVKPTIFEAGVNAILNSLIDLRKTLYTTICRECGRRTEILYTVWSYRVLCSSCGHEFLLWDHCRKYGARSRDHKILSEFPCPACTQILHKSRLKRTIAEPVQIGYKCCGSRQQEVMHPLNKTDLELIYRLEITAPLAEGFYPQIELPDGLNLRQPRFHGINSIDRFYTPRNLAAMSHIWRAIHQIEDLNLAAHLAFIFTSLYQRVTRLSEFRFWGGSGNTARFNVPFIFNEANVFLTFARKARTIQDHLEATASHYQGKAFVIENSATLLDYLPDDSIDLIFTDPPFGANINYSDMNYLWESWLGKFTDTRTEAIINRLQGKDVYDYQHLMSLSLKECYRVLRSGHWMLLVFMNSSSTVWTALRSAIADAGFKIKKVDIFDKQHGTFKQFVSDNTTGCDLVLHCLKPDEMQQFDTTQEPKTCKESIITFLKEVDFSKQINVYLHVSREQEIDFRKLYSEWTANAILQNTDVLDFAEFRSIVEEWIIETRSRH